MGCESGRHGQSLLRSIDPRVSTHRFEAVLGGETGDLPGVVLPADVAAAMGGRARIPVAGTINGVPFRGSTMPMGDGTHCVGFRRTRRRRAECGGARSPIEIARDDAPSRIARLAAALDADPAVRAAFDAMSYTHRKGSPRRPSKRRDAPAARPGRRGGPGADRVEIGAGVARACPPTYRKVCFETCLSIRH